MKVLTLSTYPIATPRHGGQHRLRNIVAAYRAAGHQTQSVGVLGNSMYPVEDGFIACPAHHDLARYIANPFLMEDWAIGQLVVNDGRFFAQLASEIRDTPDLIHVEQPWLFPFANRYAAQCTDHSVRVLYGSANIEHQLKQRILSGYFGPQRAAEAARLVYECEVEAARGADTACATSTHDADWLRRVGARQVILAPNGVCVRETSEIGITEANAIIGHRKCALYCASAHPPNVVGFFDIFGRGVGCFAPNERLVVAGSAGPSVASDHRFDRVPGLRRRYISTGEVSESCLQGLFEVSHAVVLPITYGEGTNLKTAEALWAGRHVVATPVSMRGFEQFIEAQGVHICADPDSFRRVIRSVMESEPLELTLDERLRRETLLWDNTLKPLIQHIGQLH